MTQKHLNHRASTSSFRRIVPQELTPAPQTPAVPTLLLSSNPLPQTIKSHQTPFQNNMLNTTIDASRHPYPSPYVLSTRIPLPSPRGSPLAMTVRTPTHGNDSLNRLTKLPAQDSSSLTHSLTRRTAIKLSDIHGSATARPAFSHMGVITSGLATRRPDSRAPPSRCAETLSKDYIPSNSNYPSTLIRRSAGEHSLSDSNHHNVDVQHASRLQNSTKNSTTNSTTNSTALVAHTQPVPSMPKATLSASNVSSYGAETRSHVTTGATGTRRAAADDSRWSKKQPRGFPALTRFNPHKMQENPKAILGSVVSSSQQRNVVYRLERVLQSAIYGAVYLSYEFPAAGGNRIRKVALKIMLRDMEKKHKGVLQEDFTAELKFRNDMKGHRNILVFDQYWEDKECLFIVMPFAEYEDLFEVLRKRQLPFLESEVRWLFHQLLSGTDFLHRKGVGFRDHSLENVLMFLDEKTKLIVPKITDPGQAVRFQYDSNHKVKGLRADKLFGKSFRPPEVYLRHLYDPVKVDVFCMGWMLFFALTKHQIFDKAVLSDPHWSLIVKGKYDELLKLRGGTFITPSLRELLWSMLNPDPRLRPTARECLKHEWFNESRSPIDERTVLGKCPPLRSIPAPPPTPLSSPQDEQTQQQPTARMLDVSALLGNRQGIGAQASARKEHLVMKPTKGVTSSESAILIPHFKDTHWLRQALTSEDPTNRTPTRKLQTPRTQVLSSNGKAPIAVYSRPALHTTQTLSSSAIPTVQLFNQHHRKSIASMESGSGITTSPGAPMGAHITGGVTKRSSSSLAQERSTLNPPRPSAANKIRQNDSISHSPAGVFPNSESLNGTHSSCMTIPNSPRSPLPASQSKMDDSSVDHFDLLQVPRPVPPPGRLTVSGIPDEHEHKLGDHSRALRSKISDGVLVSHTSFNGAQQRGASLNAVARRHATRQEPRLASNNEHQGHQHQGHQHQGHQSTPKGLRGSISSYHQTPPAGSVTSSPHSNDKNSSNNDNTANTAETDRTTRSVTTSRASSSRRKNKEEKELGNKSIIPTHLDLEIEGLTLADETPPKPPGRKGMLKSPKKQKKESESKEEKPPRQLWSRRAMLAQAANETFQEDESNVTSTPRLQDLRLHENRLLESDSTYAPFSQSPTQSGLSPSPSPRFKTTHREEALHYVMQLARRMRQSSNALPSRVAPSEPRLKEEREVNAHLSGTDRVTDKPTDRNAQTSHGLQKAPPSTELKNLLLAPPTSDECQAAVDLLSRSASTSPSSDAPCKPSEVHASQEVLTPSHDAQEATSEQEVFTFEQEALTPDRATPPNARPLLPAPTKAPRPYSNERSQHFIHQSNPFLPHPQQSSLSNFPPPSLPRIGTPFLSPQRRCPVLPSPLVARTAESPRNWAVPQHPTPLSPSSPRLIENPIAPPQLRSSLSSQTRSFGSGHSDLFKHSGMESFSSSFGLQSWGAGVGRQTLGASWVVEPNSQLINSQLNESSPLNPLLKHQFSGKGLYQNSFTGYSDILC